MPRYSSMFTLNYTCIKEFDLDWGSNMDNDGIDALSDQLDYFIRLSQAQAEQIKHYKELQQRSHKLIRSLISKQAKKEQQQSWKKTGSS